MEPLYSEEILSEYQLLREDQTAGDSCGLHDLFVCFVEGSHLTVLATGYWTIWTFGLLQPVCSYFSPIGIYSFTDTVYLFSNCMYGLITYSKTVT